MGVWMPGPGATAGDDVFAGDATDELAESLAGNDILTGEGGNDDLRGGEGADVLDGGDGNDSLYSGDPGPLIVGDEFVDEMLGGAGDDHLFGELRDLFDGGEDFDIATLTFRNSVEDTFLDLRDLLLYIDGQTLGLPDGGSLTNIEQVFVLGGVGNDTIYLNSTGFGGLAQGGEGSDTIFGGTGVDSL